MQDQKGTLGKLVYNSDFHDSAKSFLDNGNAVIKDVRAGKGTLGKLATDDSFTPNIARWAKTSPARRPR